MTNVRRKVQLTMNYPQILLLLLFTLLIASSCANRPSVSVEPPLEPKMQITMGGDGQVAIHVGMRNVGNKVFSAQQNYGAVMQIRDGAGSLRAKIEIHQFGPLDPNQSEMPGGWKGILDPGDYELTWSVPNEKPIATRISVVNENGKLILKADHAFISPFTEYTVPVS